MTINPDGDAHGRPPAVPSPFSPPERRSDFVIAETAAALAAVDVTTDPDPRTEYTVPSATPDVFELYDRDDRQFSIYGMLLGFGTSRWEDHTHDPYFIDRLTMIEYTNVVRSRLRDLRDRFATRQLPRSVFTAATEEATDYLRCLENPNAHPENVRRFADQGERCSACRWFELRIFRVEHEYDDSLPCNCGAEPSDPELAADVSHAVLCSQIPARARYLVLTYGRSDVPGEFSKRRAVWTNSPHEIDVLLTQRQHDRGTKFMPSTSQRALAQAAALDPDIERLFMQQRQQQQQHRTRM